VPWAGRLIMPEDCEKKTCTRRLYINFKIKRRVWTHGEPLKKLIDLKNAVLELMDLNDGCLQVNRLTVHFTLFFLLLYKRVDNAYHLRLHM
jgi:hypothetical protein